MQHSRFVTAAAAIAIALSATNIQAQDTSRTVTDGGISVPGWAGKIDAQEAAQGQVLNNSRFAAMGDGFHVTTGPAVTYWNPANTASGSYTVSATFNEPQYMNLNNHPHPYGIAIGGNDLGTDAQSYLYCAAYGNGNFIVRGFGPEAFQLNGARPTAHEAVNRAAGQGQPVSQQIAVSVTPTEVSCSINGQVVGTYPRADVVASGKLKSTDGVYGLRFAHNTEVMVSDLKVTTP